MLSLSEVVGDHKVLLLLLETIHREQQVVVPLHLRDSKAVEQLVGC